MTRLFGYSKELFFLILAIGMLLAGCLSQAPQASIPTARSSSQVTYNPATVTLAPYIRPTSTSVAQQEQIVTPAAFDQNQVITKPLTNLFKQADLYGYWQTKNTWGDYETPIGANENVVCGAFQFSGGGFPQEVCNYSSDPSQYSRALQQANETAQYQKSIYGAGKGGTTVSFDIEQFTNIADAKIGFADSISELKSDQYEQKLEIKPIGDESVSALKQTPVGCGSLDLIFRRNNLFVKSSLRQGVYDCPTDEQKQELWNYAALIDQRLRE